MNNIIIHTLNAEEFAYTPRCPSRQFGRLGSLLVADFSTAKNGKAVRGIPRTDMLLKIQGGGIQGTWMHEDVALEFARWLSPAFAIWCNDRIKELLKNGSTELPTNGYAMQLPKTYSEALRQLADAVEAKEKVQLQLAAKTEQLDESKDWYSIKRWAKEHGMNWRKVSWRALKAISAEHGLGVKKIFDGNYGEVNIYHRKAFAILYGK